LYKFEIHVAVDLLIGGFFTKVNREILIRWGFDLSGGKIFARYEQGKQR
jgi:hypothetical protein